MSKLGEIFKAAGVSEISIITIIQKLKNNPIEAMTAIQALNLPNDTVQNIMGTVMMNPKAIEELAFELGLDDKDVQAIKSKLNQTTEM